MQNGRELHGFCLSLPGSKRRERVLPRLARALDDFEIVDGTVPGSERDTFYRQGVDPGDHPLVACFAGHLAALARFVESGKEHGLVCEDDVLFRKDFRERFAEVWTNVPDDLTLLSLCTMAERWDGAAWAGKDPEKRNLARLTDAMWGCVAYVISRPYAKMVLALYDRPFRELSPPATSELIVRGSGGLLTMPLLAIEESLDSERGDVAALPYHRHHFQSWGLENYDLAGSPPA